MKWKRYMFMSQVNWELRDDSDDWQPRMFQIVVNGKGTCGIDIRYSGIHSTYRQDPQDEPPPKGSETTDRPTHFLFPDVKTAKAAFMSSMSGDFTELDKYVDTKFYDLMVSSRRVMRDADELIKKLQDADKKD